MLDYVLVGYIATDLKENSNWLWKHVRSMQYDNRVGKQRGAEHLLSLVDTSGPWTHYTF